MSKAKAATDSLDLASGTQHEGRLWNRVLRISYTNFVAPLTLSRHPAWFDARGVAAGLVIGLGLPVGGHILALTALRALVRFNYLAAIAFTWVCNPFNMLFVYYGYYCLGSVMLGECVSIDLAAFKKAFCPVLSKSYFWEEFSAFMQLGGEILVRWFVAATAVAIVSGLVGYLVTYRLQSLRCKRTAEKMGVEYEAYVKELGAPKPKRGANRPAH